MGGASSTIREMLDSPVRAALAGVFLHLECSQETHVVSLYPALKCLRQSKRVKGVERGAVTDFDLLGQNLCRELGLLPDRGLPTRDISFYQTLVTIRRTTLCCGAVSHDSQTLFLE